MIAIAIMRCGVSILKDLYMNLFSLLIICQFVVQVFNEFLTE